MSLFHRWLRITCDLAGIGSAILAVWAIPLFYERGIAALLPAGLVLALVWLAVTALGCLGIWLQLTLDGMMVRPWGERPSLPQATVTGEPA